MRVPVTPDCPADADCRTGRPASSLRISLKAVNGINHQAGHVLGGLFHHQQFGEDSAWGSDHILRMRHWRNPNCDYADIWLLLSLYPTTPFSIVAQAGSGASQLVTLYSDVTAMRELLIRLPWDTSDSGWENIEIDTNGANVVASAAWDVPRDELDDGDMGVDLLDGTYRAIGLIEGRDIAESEDAGPDRLVDAVIDAWGLHRQTALTWWTNSALVSTSASWTNPFPNSFTVPHRARYGRETETELFYDVIVRCRTNTAGTTFQVRASSNNNTVTSGSKGNTSFSYETLADLLVSCDSDDEIEIEIIRTSGTGGIEIDAVTIGEAQDSVP